MIKHAGFLIWTMILASALGLLIYLINKPIVHSGQTIEFLTKNGWQFNLSENGNFEAFASGFFVLKKESGETITAKPSTPPLGWDDNEYFVADQPISPGTWLIEHGESIDIRITLDQTSTIARLLQNDVRVGLVIVLSVVFVVVWFISLAHYNTQEE